MRTPVLRSDYDTPHYKCEASTNETSNDSDESLGA